MLEILDIGNTFTRIATWNGGRFTDLRRLPTEKLILNNMGVSRVAACVCPEVEERLNNSGIKFISAVNNFSKVDFSLVDTSTLGADRVANAIAAAEFYSLPVAVIDCGTALTLEVVDEKRRFSGGAIAPGRMLLRQALAQGTAQLPEIPLTDSMPTEIGNNTADAIRFGVDAGAIGTVREWLRILRKKYPRLTVVIAGGDSRFFAAEIPDAMIADEYFTLHGIRLAASVSET